MARPVALTLGRRLVTRWLAHTYSRSVVTVGADTTGQDTPGYPSVTYGTATTGLPCLYQAEETIVIDAQGRRVISVPSLYVDRADTLKVGDRVSAIADRDAASLISGTFVVESIDVNAGAGGQIFRRAALRAAKGKP